MYVKYIKDTCGPDSIVVIDGYPEELTTKDQCHEQRSGAEVGPTIGVQLDIRLTSSP